MPVKHGILGLLAKRPYHGYKLKTGFDDLTAGQWELNVGQVYTTLDRMIRDDLVAVEKSDGSGNDRKVYRITEGGLEELESWLQFPPLRSRPYRSEVYVRLALQIERDLSAALDLIDTHRRVHHIQMADLTRQKLALARSQEQTDRLRRELILDAAIMHVEADLKWLEVCEDRIRARAQRGDAPLPESS